MVGRIRFALERSDSPRHRSHVAQLWSFGHESAMNLFEVTTFLSPIGGAVGGAVAVHRGVPSAPAWMLAAIPVGLVCGIGCYRGLVRLAVGKHDKNPKMPDWRIAAMFGVCFIAPYFAGVLTYGLVRLVLYAVA